MRIRFITSTPLNVHRGSGTFVGIQTLSRALEHLGHAVEIVAPSIHLPVYTAERILFNERLRFRRLGSCDLSVGFDLDGYSIAGREGSRHAAAIKGVIADEVRYESGIVKLMLSVQAKYEALHVRRADLVIATSRYSSQVLGTSYGVSANHVVPEPIDLSGWRQALAGAEVRQSSEQFVVLCVCRLYRRKRVDRLLEAATLVRRSIPELLIRIVGTGPEGPRLRALCRDRGLESAVRWLGDVPQEQLVREYKNCDVFCMPSVQEGFGIVFLEAMAASKPIVACRAAAIPEVVPDAMLVEPDSGEALAEGIERLYRDTQLRDEIARQGGARVTHYDAPGVAQAFLDRVQAGLNVKMSV